MAYDIALAERIGELLGGTPGVTRKEMFGGTCFLVRGNMVCGVLKNRLILRVGPAHYEEILRKPHVRKFDITGRPLRGFVYVLPAAFPERKSLQSWLILALRFATTLPPKRKKIPASSAA